LNADSGGVAGTFVYTPASGTVLNAGNVQSLSVSFTPDNTVNYNTPAATSVAINVAKATPVITWANPADITFGTGLSGTQLNATSGGVAGTFVYTPVSGTVLNAGNAQSLLVAFTPTDAANFNSAAGSASVLVNKATPVITWATPATVYFGTALSATQLNASSGGVAGAFTYTPVSGTVMSTVGVQALSVTFSPSDSANYNSQSASVNLDVTNKIVPAVTWATPAAIIFGTALDAIQLNASAGAVAGSFSYSPAAGTVLSAGTHNITATFSPTDTTTYSSTSANVNLLVNQAAATVTLSGTAHIYDGTPKGITVTTVPAGISVNVTYNGSATLPTTSGSYAVVATITDLNYTGSASGTLVIAKVTPVITWAAPATITYGTALSGTQLNATSGGVAGAFVYTPASGTVMNAGNAQTLTVTFTPTDSANYTTQSATVSLTVNPLPANQIFTGVDGKTTIPITITTSGATVTIAAGTLLTDAEGIPISGTLTVAATVMSSTDALPSGAATAKTSGGTILSAFGNSIDITISAGSVMVKNISPAMIVNLAIPPAFAVPGTIVTYYSYNGTTWNPEGTATVKPDGTIDMPVGHLSVWAVAIFTDGILIPTQGKTEPVLADALKSLRFAMKVETPSANDILHGDVAPLVNGVPQPDGLINLGDTIVTLRRVVGL
jgi:hypothetical protein